MTPLLTLVAYFFGGAFMTNALPHLLSGVMGRAFQSPFGDPPGRGLSSSTVNVLWGWFNIAVGYLLTAHVGNFQLQSWTHVLAFGTGGMLVSLHAARHFGAFHGGLGARGSSSGAP